MIPPELITDARDVLVMAAVICLAWWARVPLLLLAAWLAGRRGRKDTGWWSNRQLVAALVDAGILKVHEGERLTLSYRGAPSHTDTGTTVKVGLPQTRTLTDVLAHGESLASALKVPVARLEVSQGEDDPANVVTFHVSNGTVREVPAEVTDAARTSWSDPVRIGADTRSKPIYLATVEANTLLAGMPGAGKTSLARVVLGHYLLDPTTALFILDGKGSKADYGDCRPLCAQFVSGVEEDAVGDTLAMLTEVLELVRTRNASGTSSHPGVLLLLEEFQDVRAAADRTERERLDKLLGRVVRMGRAVSVHVLISTQRPSADDVPSGVRNLVSQRIALMLRNGADAALVLGVTPTLALPRRRGHALQATTAGTRAVVLDRLTEDAWRGLCARATTLRATHTPSPPWDMGKPSQGLTEVPTALSSGGRMLPATMLSPLVVDEDDMQDARVSRFVVAVDPLMEDVLEVLADADPAGMTATELHAALPDWHEYVPTPRALGIELRRHPEVERVSRRDSTGASIRVWRSVNGQCPQGRASGGAGVSVAVPRP